MAEKSVELPDDGAARSSYRVSSTEQAYQLALRQHRRRGTGHFVRTFLEGTADVTATRTRETGTPDTGVSPRPQPNNRGTDERTKTKLSDYVA